MGRQHKFLKILSFSLIMGLVFTPFSPATSSTQIDIIGPPGSVLFGASVIVLPNGNFVVCDPFYNDGVIDGVGAVYLYNGANGEQISMLTGSTSGDMVGYDGVTLLENGNYIVRSPHWDNGSAIDAGAVTWGNGTTGIMGTVSADNSLVGSTSNDLVGYSGVTALTNGNYVVSSLYWDNSMVVDAGAATWGDGTKGITGTVSVANSLVGSTASDHVGDYNAVIPLTNSSYVVHSPEWDNGTAKGAGAVTWVNGTTGITGTVSATNSLVGSSDYDRIGSGGIKVLSNGNFVVNSPEWNNGEMPEAGAVTWGSGTSGVIGVVSEANSLIGSTNYDRIGFYGVTALANGNYVVDSPYWNTTERGDVGAVTWGNGMTGITGHVSSGNSLVGSRTFDYIGWEGVIALANGNYVVSSSYWDNGALVDVGAATWGSGTSGISGEVSISNSLVGQTAGDGGFMSVTAMTNGNFVVRSPFWSNAGAVNAGAVTWGDGTKGITGTISTDNSLVGSTAYDSIGSVIPLSNGNYVVGSPYWDNGGAEDLGAVTWGDGTKGISGEISTENSLVGSTSNDLVSEWGVTPLANGNYVVNSIHWDNGWMVDAGAVTWGDGTRGITGEVSEINSLVGSMGDNIGSGNVITLTNGNYLVSSPGWSYGEVPNPGAVTWGDGTKGITGAVSPSNSLVGISAYWGVIVLTNGNFVIPNPSWVNGGIVDAGAVTWGDGTIGITGEISESNSLVGSTSGDQIGTLVEALPNGNYVIFSPDFDNGAAIDSGAVTWGYGTADIAGQLTVNNSVFGSAINNGYTMVSAYDHVNSQLIVGRPYDNIVTLFRMNRFPIGPYAEYMPMIFNQESP